MQFEWLRECLRARRSGKEEPTREEFLGLWNDASTWRKIDRSRKCLAKGLYRNGGFAFSSRKVFSAVTNIAGAFILQPSYVYHRLKTQLGANRK